MQQFDKIGESEKLQPKSKLCSYKYWFDKKINDLIKRKQAFSSSLFFMVLALSLSFCFSEFYSPYLFTLLTSSQLRRLLGLFFLPFSAQTFAFFKLCLCFASNVFCLRIFFLFKIALNVYLLLSCNFNVKY